MFMSTVLGEGEAESSLESLLYAELQAERELPPLRMGKHFEEEVFLVGACVMTAVHFDNSEIGIEQYGALLRGSEIARKSGQGQRLPQFIGEFHSQYQNDRLSLSLDCDSYTPERLLHLGYVAVGVIPENGMIEFVDPEVLAASRISDLVAA